MFFLRMELAVNVSLTKAVVTDAAGDVEKSQLAAIRSEMAMFESSGKRRRGLQIPAEYSASISRRRKSLFGCWCLMHESAISTE